MTLLLSSVVECLFEKGRGGEGRGEGRTRDGCLWRGDERNDDLWV